MSKPKRAEAASRGLVVDVIHCAACHRVLRVTIPRYRDLDVGGDGPELEMSDVRCSTPGSGGVVCSCSRQDLRLNRRIVAQPEADSPSNTRSALTADKAGYRSSDSRRTVRLSQLHRTALAGAGNT